jgi:hypothetical protein
MSLNWRIYKFLNPNLKFETRIEYERHFVEYGKRERRRYSVYNLYPDFDHKQYKTNYFDLYHYSISDLELHWLTTGVIEKRTYKKVLNWIYIVNGVNIGGTSKYINDLIEYYGIYIRMIRCKKELNMYNFRASDIIMIQQLAFTDITPDDLVHIKINKQPRMFIILHDFTFLNKNIYNTSNEIHHKSYINRVNEVIPQVHLLFKAVNNVICPSKFIYDEYSKRIPNINFIIVNHTDYRCDMNRILVPKITNVINIGVFNIISEVKGSEYVSYLMKKYTAYKGFRINYVVVGVTIGTYKEGHFFELLKKYNIHGLLLLNKYGESWCYLLTKYLFSGLPILYNNIGSFKERITPLENRFSVGDTDGVIDIVKLNKGFEDMVNYIIVNGKIGKRIWTDGAELIKPDFFVHLFR